MGYIVQKTRVSQLLIGGEDYTSSLVSFQVSDSGAFKKGLMTTSGNIVLGQKLGFSDIEDYDRNLFKRGTVVTLDITEPGGAAYRHPRGYLYVIGTTYDVESERLTVEVACRLSLAYLTDNPDAILPLVPIPLDPAQRTVENCSASFASAGMILYQDNQGDLVSRKFFGSDTTAGFEPGEWVSVLDKTALSVSPLTNGGAIPDEIDLAYQVPAGALADDNTGKVDTVTETSNYFINYPATVWQRTPNPTPSGTIKLPDRIVKKPPIPRPPSGCGNTPQPPAPGGIEVRPGGELSFYLCNDLWQTDRVAVYLPATRVSVSTTTYGGPGGQTSLVEQTVTGPEIEANPGYFADKFAYCASTYGYACNPQGSCPYFGFTNSVLSKSLTYYEYGNANELVRTIQDTFETKLSAYLPSEYRAGIQNGLPAGFNDTLSASDGLYRTSRVITEYYKQNNSNIQLTTTYSSITSRGVGATAGASIDALNGIKTSVRRESTTTTTLDVRPDAVNSATTSTDEKSTKIRINIDGYVSPPSEAGAYVLEDSIPVPMLSTSSSQINGWVNDYSNYLSLFTTGDLYGLQVGEALRSEFASSWYPGMPFRFADTANDRILAMRMDACAWGVNQQEAIVVTNGIWLGFSTGTLSAGSNLVGNSRPDMSPGLGSGTDAVGGIDAGTPSPQPPTTPDPPPVIDDDLVGRSYEIDVDVFLYLDTSMFTYFDDGISTPNPTDMEANIEQAIVPYVEGFVVETGGLLETEGSGSLPSEYAGSLVTASAVVVDADVFAA